MVHSQKQRDEASKQSQEETKSLSEETAMLRREIDESSMFPKSMVEWRTSEQSEEIRELKANNIALQGSVNTEKSLDPATLSPDPGESLVKLLTQQIRELQDTVHVLQEAVEFEDQEPANGEVSGRTSKRESQPCL